MATELVQYLAMGGPFHQSSCLRSSCGSIPLEAQSTGFVHVGTWFHVESGNNVKTLATRFPTKV